jgi:hypothetical protein
MNELEKAKTHFNAQPVRFSNAKQWQLSLDKYKPASQEVVLLYGDAADCGQFDDSGKEVFGVAGGKHHGHVVTVYTAKHNCGAYEETHICSCGEEYENGMYGCWQQSHQREERGKPIV